MEALVTYRTHGAVPLYVIDHHGSRIVKMGPDGSWVNTWGPGLVGSDIPLSRPESIAVDTRGSVYVGDGDNPRVVKLLPEGRFVTTIPNQASSHVAVDANRNIYVTNDPLTKYSASGTVLATWP